MPKTAADLTLRELNTLRRQAREDPTFQTQRADGRQTGLTVRVRKGQVVFWFRTRRPGGKRAIRRIRPAADAIAGAIAPALGLTDRATVVPLAPTRGQ